MNGIGWKRLLLTRQQKFLYDLSMLGKQRDPVDQFLYNLENWISLMYWLRICKKHLRRLVINIYWYTFPKQLYVCPSGTYIHERLPWGKRSELYRSGLSGKVFVAGGGRKYTTYSWRKAYRLMLENQKKAQHQEIQWKLNKRFKGCDEPAEASVQSRKSDSDKG